MAVAGPPPTAAAIPSFAVACGLVWQRYSCLVVAPHRRHVALAPRYLGRKRTGIRAQLDAELLRYSESLQGVPVAYDNIKVVGALGDIYDDQGFIHLNIEADFVIFSPKKGKKLVGVINKVAPSHIGCLIHGCFNASIPKPEQMSVAQWQDLGLKIGDELKFQVLHLDSDAAGVFFIRGGLTKSRMKPKKSGAVTDSANGDETQKLDHQENSLNDSVGDNVTEKPFDETSNTGKENAEEQSVSAMNGLCDDKNKKKKKKTHKPEENVLPTTDSSGYQSDHKRSKKRKHCSEVEASELSQLSQEPKAKKTKKELQSQVPFLNKSSDVFDKLSHSKEKVRK
ncbi:DNA-directed RNA polymerase I subunit RPA43 [Pezoporus wallicus]|uniref:DNA-directed RNA polymerase I subunit RPA43 n=1 Tax=Pezoporus wallicus TaxID=35540 RepID=UPI0025518424|nr:DNA-directed RNA polymerase I subunit RPA43 [Pezoporus wallicus]XP_061325187.1 DNA-directed RNA polymerase I subunit RPA43 [Pezoporus flaviventris]